MIRLVTPLPLPEFRSLRKGVEVVKAQGGPQRNETGYGCGRHDHPLALRGHAVARRHSPLHHLNVRQHLQQTDPRDLERPLEGRKERFVCRNLSRFSGFPVGEVTGPADS